MRILVLVTSKIHDATKEELLDWVKKRHTVVGAAFDCATVDAASNPTTLADGYDAAYAASEVASVIATSDALADWGRNWGIVRRQGLIVFAFKKPVRKLRYGKHTTRMPISTHRTNWADINLQAQGDL